MNLIINHFTPLQKVSRSLAKLRTKLWITKGNLKSIKIQDKIYGKMCRTKNVSKKEELNLTFKKCRNNKTKVIRLGKANHYDNYLKAKKLILHQTW